MPSYLEEKFEIEFRKMNLTPKCIDNDNYEIIEPLYNLQVFGPTPEECLDNAKKELFAKYESSIMLEMIGV